MQTPETPASEPANDQPVAVENGTHQPKEQNKRRKNKNQEGNNERPATAKPMQYRVKGEKQDDVEQDPNQKEQARPNTAKDGNKKKNRKPKQNDENQEETTDAPKANGEPKYRVKGEKTNEDQADGENAQKKKEPKKKEEQEKNLVYKNPFDFKEKKKFSNKWEEYRFGEWRKGSGKTFVTLETEIPELPKNKIEAPDEAAFHKRQVEIDNKIKDMYNELNELKTKFTDFIE